VPSQGRLSSVVRHEVWLSHLDACTAFDVLHTSDPSLPPHRETTRFISSSQHGSGAYLQITPDDGIAGSRIHSRTFIASVQYRAGLFISALKPALDALAAAGTPVTTAERLGDAFINAKSSGKARRHNAVLACWATAIRAASTTSVIQGDKGNGQHHGSSSAEAKQRYAHFNAGHVPDLIWLSASPSGSHVLFEVKVYTPFLANTALGHGSQRNGGAPSTTEGHHLAFGNTEEALLRLILGTRQRGQPTDRPLDHSTGYGYVAAHSGHYADGIAKGNDAIPLISETLGGINRTAVNTLHRLHALTAPASARDGTQYGISRSATTSFHAHHLRLISLATHRENIAILLAAADRLDLKATAHTPLPTLQDFIPVNSAPSASAAP
jgi:hypothetical protein